MAEQSRYYGADPTGTVHFTEATVNDHRATNRVMGVWLIVIGCLIAAPALLFAIVGASVGVAWFALLCLIPVAIGAGLIVIGVAARRSNPALPDRPKDAQ